LFGGHALGASLPKLKLGAAPVLVENAKAVYDGAIRFNDLQFGRLIEKLKAIGEYDDTLIILIADHGEEHLDHGEGGHGQQLFNEVAQVPMIVKYPKGRLAGTLAAFRSSLLDVAPTVLAVAGAEVPESFEGIDLAHLPSGAASSEVKRSLLLDLNQVRLDGVLFVARAVVDGPYKYIEDLLPERKTMLFDLDADPGETRNIIDSDSTCVRTYARLLKDYQATAVRDAVPLDLREGLKALGYLN
jgi:arylsulfatase A-like enzyme